MATTFTLISTITVGSGGAATISFTSIPSTYTDLCLKVSARTNYAASVNDGLQIYFNGLTTNLTTRELYGTGSAAGSGTDTVNKIGYMTAINATTNTFGNGEIYIPNYTSSNYKSSSGDGVSESNATGAFMAMNANLWSSTDAITSITLKSANAGSQVFQQYSTASLYGILKA